MYKSDLREKLKKMSPEKRLQVLKMLNERRGSAKKKSVYPCTYAQERFFFQHQLEPVIGVCNTPVFSKIKGPLSVNILEKSINRVIQRHAPLRTRFDPNSMMQIVEEKAEIFLNQLDVTDIQRSSRDDYLRTSLMEFLDRRFDITEVPLIRAILVKDEGDSFILGISVHHIIMDGWSLKIFLSEIIENYCAFKSGLEPNQDSLEFTYEDYVWRQRNPKTEEVFVKQLQYWIKELEGIPERLDIPGDYLRPKQRTCIGRTKNYPLSKESSFAIEHLVKEFKTSHFMIISTALSFLLCKYSNMTDIVMGTPFGIRQPSEAEKLIGLFQNMLVIRNNCEGDPSFKEMLERVKKTAIAAYDHSDVPFERIVQEINPKREGSFTPLFQILLSHNNAPLEEVQFAGLTISPYLIEVERVDCDLTFMYTTEGKNVSSMRIEYSTDLFSQKNIDTMFRSLELLFIQAAKDPSCLLSAMKLLDKAGERELLTQLKKSPRVNKGFHRMEQFFENSVKNYPDSIAVSQSGIDLTYAELAEKSSELAKHIYTKTGGRNKTIPVVMNLSPDMIVSFIAIVKAGAAYVFVDPDLPTSRIQYILDDCDCPFYISRANHFDIQSTLKQSAMFMDQLSSGIILDNIDVKLHEGQNSNAYVVYTSGTTGRPKGVVITHQGAVNTISYAIDEYNFCEKDKILSVSPPNFDLSVFDVFGVLGVGARLVLPDFDRRVDPIHWAELFLEYGITTWNSVPLFMEMLLSELLKNENEYALETLRLAFLGGDWIAKDLALRMRALSSSPIRIVSIGGVTECSIFSIVYDIEDVPDRLKSVPYGKAIPNMETYVLDSNTLLLPIGLEGELYISGVGVGKGYLNDADLTNERFVPNPFNPEYPIMYKTGDRVRYLSDGNLEFLGREDFQVKLQGVRTELNEISEVISSHPKIYQAALHLNQGSDSFSELVAFIIPQDCEFEILSDLRNYLSKKLPKFMMPNRYEIVRELPKTANGKLDRNALKKLAQKKIEDRFSSGSFTEFHSQERIYEEIWVAEDLNKKEIRKSSLNILVFSDESNFCKGFIEECKKRGFKTWIVCKGAQFKCCREHKWFVDPEKPEHYDRLISELKATKGIFSVVHFWFLMESHTKIILENHQKITKQYINPLLYLFQATAKVKKNAVNWEINVFSKSQFLITGDEDLKVHHSLLRGLLLVIPQESKQFKSRCIDFLDKDFVKNSKVFNKIFNEILTLPTNPFVAFREGSRFIKSYRQISDLEPQPSRCFFENDAVYGLIGGFGGLGREVINFLLMKGISKIAVLSRSSIPDLVLCEEILKDPNHPDYERVKFLQLLKEKGVELLHIRGDSANLEDVGKFRDVVKKKWGGFTGVIYLAAVIQNNFLERVTSEDIRKVFHAKVFGTFNAIETFKNENLKFFHIFSSLAAICGYVSGAVYSSANAFQNSISDYYNDKLNFPICSISWPTWKDLGLADFKSGRYPGIPKAFIEENKKALTVDQGLAIYKKIFSTHHHHLIVSQEPLCQLLKNDRPLQNLDKFLELDGITNLVIQGEVDSSLKKIINSLREMWVSLLRHDRFTDTDNFFDVGGHSILATQLVSRVNSKFDLNMKMTTIFNTPSIKNLAKSIKAELES